MLEYWLAVDVYPEYGNEVQEIMNFISEMNTEKQYIESITQQMFFYRFLKIASLEL